MRMEQSAGIVLFRPTSEDSRFQPVGHRGMFRPTSEDIPFMDFGGTLFLLLKYPAGHWDFVKGHMEHGETAREAAIRESLEETGIADLDFVKGFRQNMRYSFTYNGRIVHKKVIFFLARTGTSDVRLSDEHLDFVWTDYQQSMKQVTFRNARKLLYTANRYISIHNIC